MKIDDNTRNTFAIAIIMLAVVVGAVYQFIIPKMQMINSNNANATVLINDDNALSQDIAITNRLKIVAQRVKQIESINQRATDPGILFDRLLALADSAGIEFEYIDPEQASKDKTDYTIIGYKAKWNSTYEQICTFINSLDDLGVYYVIRSINIVPVQIDNRNMASIRLQVDFVKFFIDDILKQEGTNPNE